MAELNSFAQPVGAPVPDWTPPALPERIVHSGKYCRLEPLDVEEHGPALFSHLNGDAKSWTYLPSGPFEKREAFIDWMKVTCQGDDPLFFAIVRQSDGAPVGMAAYLRIAPTAGSIEVGHILYSDVLKRTPAATEAMYLMMKHAFDLGYRRYEWKCDSLNAASQSAAKRLGFTFEGIFRQAMIYKGRNRDTAWFSVIDSEWPLLDKAFTDWLKSENFASDGTQISSLRDLMAGARKPADNGMVAPR